MKSIVVALFIAVALSVANAGDGHQRMTRHSAAFDKLMSLVGVWEGKDEQGNPVRVSYRIVSDSSTLMETMDMGDNEGVMITMYHTDGDALMVTHYCSMGNQPRMKSAGLSQDGTTLDFSYIDATNLATPDADRMEKLVVKFKDADHFAQEWTARMNGELDHQAVFEYTRSK